LVDEFGPARSKLVKVSWPGITCNRWDGMRSLLTC
jgi:hypothetical protein